MKNILFIFLFVCVYSNAQVGIGTTNPNATLEIKATNPTTGLPTDGILIPKVDNLPATSNNPSANQDGMLVFVTGNSTKAKGFYYWDNTLANWIQIKSGVNNNIPFVTRAQLDAITTPQNGQLVYDSTDDVTLMWNGSNWIVLSDNCFPQPTIANAGSNQPFYDATTSVALAANTPVEGTGQWSIVSGTGGSFANANDPLTTFTGSPCTSYTLRWTITTACASSSSDVYITFYQQPTTAYAGPTQNITTASTSVTLAANAPILGETGQWSIVSGTGGSFVNANDPHTTFTGNPCTAYTLRWTITTCASSTSNVTTITFNQQPSTAANAGNTINSPTSTTVTLAANAPGTGETGQWTILNGGTGTFTPNANSPTATFTATTNNTKYTLQWTISNAAACVNSSDTVTIYVGNVVGEYAYGGVIFYIDATGNHGLVCATTEPPKQVWTCDTTVTGATGSAIGTGVTNTPLITSTAGCTYAAQTCRNLNLNGHTDWFLPSLNELGKLYTNRSYVNQTLVAIGGTRLFTSIPYSYDSYYWSSTENSSTSAQVKKFASGGTSSRYKPTSLRVRAIRAF